MYIIKWSVCVRERERGGRGEIEREGGGRERYPPHLHLKFLRAASMTVLIFIIKVCRLCVTGLICIIQLWGPCV